MFKAAESRKRRSVLSCFNVTDLVKNLGLGLKRKVHIAFSCFTCGTTLESWSEKIGRTFCDSGVSLMRIKRINGSVIFLAIVGCAPPCGDGTVESERECIAAYEEIDCGEGTVPELSTKQRAGISE